MISWVPFEAVHARQIVEANVRPQEKWAAGGYTDKWVDSLKDRLWAYTLTEGDAPIACAGLILQDWNRAEAWTLLSASFERHLLFIYRSLKIGLRYAETNMGLVRIQATIDPAYPKTVKWIEHLGFDYEGRLKRYGPQNQDYLMYARVG